MFLVISVKPANSTYRDDAERPTRRMYKFIQNRGLIDFFLM